MRAIIREMEDSAKSAEENIDRIKEVVGIFDVKD